MLYIQGVSRILAVKHAYFSFNFWTTFIKIIVISSLLMTILETIRKKLWCYNYQVNFKELEAFLQENIGPNNFVSSWWPNGWSHRLLPHILRTICARPMKSRICIKIMRHAIQNQKDKFHTRFEQNLAT